MEPTQEQHASNIQPLVRTSGAPNTGSGFTHSLYRAAAQRSSTKVVYSELPSHVPDGGTNSPLGKKAKMKTDEDSDPHAAELSISDGTHGSLHALFSLIASTGQFLSQKPVQIVGVLFLAYLCREFCIVHLYNVATPWAMEHSLSSDEVSFIFMVGNFAGVPFKLLFGMAIQKFGGEVVFHSSSLCIAAATALFTMGASARWFEAAWFGLNVFMPAGWISAVAIVAQWVPTSWQGRALAFLSMAYVGGELIVRAFIGAWLALGVSWQGCMLLCSIITLTGSILSTRVLSPWSRPHTSTEIEQEKSDDFAESSHEIGDTTTDGSLSSQGAILSPYKPSSFDTVLSLLSRSDFLCVCAMSFLLKAMRIFFMTFSVAYAIAVQCSPGRHGHATPADCTTCHQTNSRAVFASALFPAGGALSAIFAGFLKDRLQPRLRAAILLLMLLPSTPLLSLLSSWGTAAEPSHLGVFLFILGFSLIGPYSLLGGAMASDMGGKYGAAMASALADLCGAMGGVAIVALQSRLAHEWGSLFHAMFVLCISAIAISAIMLILDQLNRGQAAGKNKFVGNVRMEALTTV